MRIIKKGPEKLESQFSVNYSMILNLLSTRTLQECRTFFERSFARFQATSGSDRTLDTAEKLEQEAAELSEKGEELQKAEKAKGVEDNGSSMTGEVLLQSSTKTALMVRLLL